MGVYRSQHESLRSMWSSGPSGRSIFPAAFGRNCFEEIVAYLRFDNCDTPATERDGQVRSISLLLESIY